MARQITVIPARAQQPLTAASHAKKRIAAYCRVSTDHAEQLHSYETQVQHYTQFLSNHPEYEMGGLYTDEGITGTSTKKREGFMRMMADAHEGKFDGIITKSISRFARNTLDCLKYVRELKELGIGVYFERENIHTLDSKGEVLLSILSSLAQDESRSLSDNVKWGVQKRFASGYVRVNTSVFLGYDRDGEENLIINEREAPIVRRIFREFLHGKGCSRIAKELTAEGVKNGKGSTHWYESNIRDMLANEKYKGDARLQKTVTLDFLTKKRVQNEGEVPQYYIEDSHPAIIDRETWEAAQSEMKARIDFAEKHHIRQFDVSLKHRPFAGRLICGECGRLFGRKIWNSNDDRLRRTVWQCGEKYRVKGEVGCQNRHIDERDLYALIEQMWQAIWENGEAFQTNLERVIAGGTLLGKSRARVMLAFLRERGSDSAIDEEGIRVLVESVTVIKAGDVMVRLKDGSEMVGE